MARSEPRRTTNWRIRARFGMGLLLGLVAAFAVGLQVVLGAPLPTTTVTFNPTTYSVAYGAGTVSLSATVASSNSAAFTDGTVAFTVRPATPICTGTSATVTGASPASATASCNLGLTAPGSYNLRAAYSGSAVFQSSPNANLTSALTITKADTTTTLNSSPYSDYYGGSVTLRAQVDNASNSASLTGGTVHFTAKKGATTVCEGDSGTVSGAASVEATFSCPFLIASPNDYNVTAVYSGDTNFRTSTTGSVANALTINKIDTTTTLNATPYSDVYGGGVTLSAQVANSVNSVALTGGVVTFTVKKGAVTVCTVDSSALSGAASVEATASCLFGTAPVNDYNVTATYASDPNFKTSTTGSVSNALSITQASTSTTITATPYGGVYGNLGATLFATVANTINSSLLTGGVVTFTVKKGAVTVCTVDSGTVSGAASVNASATCLFGLAPGGDYNVFATYKSDVNFKNSSDSVTDGLTIAKASTSVVLTAPGTFSVVYGVGSVTLSADVANTSNDAALTGGTVTFKVRKGGTDICTSATTPVSGPDPVTVTATCAVGLADVGSYSVRASYNGDSNFADSTTTFVASALTITKADSSIALTAPGTFSVVYGVGTVTLSADVTNASNSADLTGGTVTFTIKQNGNTLLVTVPAAVSGAEPVTVPVSAVIGLLPPGSYDIKASYNGDGNFSDSDTGLVSAALTVTQAGTSTTLTPASYSKNYGDTSVALSAAVANTSNSADLTGGTVTFTVTDGSTTYCTATSAAVVGATPVTATATCTFSPLPVVGAYTVTAVYSGDTNFSTSTATEGSLQVSPVAALTTFTAILSPGCGDSTVSIGVRVATGGGGGTITGTITVTIKQGVNTFGTKTLTLNDTSPVTKTAIVSVSNLVTGAYTVTAVYSGDANNGGSSATPSTLTVVKAPTTVTVMAATAIYGDASVTLTAKVASVNGNALTSGAVTFVVKKGSTTVATLTSGAVVGTSPVTVSVTLPLNVGIGAGDYTIAASYNGDACFAASTGNGSLTIDRKILLLKPTDRTVGLKQANPPTTPPANCLASATATSACWLELAPGNSFVYGQSWSSLNLTNLRFTYSRNYPSSNATETVGKVYKISATGLSSANYDIRLQQGNLTVVP